MQLHSVLPTVASLCLHMDHDTKPYHPLQHKAHQQRKFIISTLINQKSYQNYFTANAALLITKRKY